MIKASAFRRWLVTRAYSSHPEPPVLRVGGDIRLPVSVKNHSLQHHNDGKKVYLDKIPLYDYNYVHNHIDAKLQIQVTKI